MFGVVDQQEQLARAERCCQRFERVAGLLVDAERGRDRVEHESGIAQRCELDEGGAVGEAAGVLAGGLQSQPRLAGAAGAGQYQKPHLVAEQELGVARRARAPGRVS